MVRCPVTPTRGKAQERRPLPFNRNPEWQCGSWGEQSESRYSWANWSRDKKYQSQVIQPGHGPFLLPRTLHANLLSALLKTWKGTIILLFTLHVSVCVTEENSPNLYQEIVSAKDKEQRYTSLDCVCSLNYTSNLFYPLSTCDLINVAI